MCHSLIHFVSQNNQRFSGYLSHAYLQCPPLCRSLDHLADVVDTISHRPLVNHHTYMPKVRVSTKQPWGSDEEQGLTTIQHQEYYLQSPREVASILIIATALHRHSIPTRWRTNVLPCRQLHACHLDKRKYTRVNNNSS
jgi:hypothetical protein